MLRKLRGGKGRDFGEEKFSALPIKVDFSLQFYAFTFIFFNSCDFGTSLVMVLFGVLISTTWFEFLKKDKRKKRNQNYVKVA